MAYAADQFLEHDNFGLGKVLCVEGDRVTIHFKKDGFARKLSAKHSPLKPSSVPHDPYFDNVKAVGATKARTNVGARSRTNKTKASGKYPTQQAAIEGFQKIFPLGFDDPKYLGDDKAGERSYKVKAHELWKETLNREQFAELIADGRFDEVIQRARQVETGVNLLHPQTERAALWSAVQEPHDAQAYAESLFELIYGEDNFETRLDRHVAVLNKLPQPKSSTVKWPVATIFPFLAVPDQHLFMKPEVTKKAAKRLGFSLNYQTKPNSSTYSSLLDLGRLLMRELAALKPKDMIDVQSFIFVTGQTSYPGS